MPAPTLDWVYHLRMGYKVEADARQGKIWKVGTEKRKLQGASGDYEVDVAIADGEKVDAVCRTDDGCINDLKGNTIQNLWKELNNMQNEQRPHKKNWLNLNK